MIKYEVTDAQKLESLKRDAEMGALRKSFTQGKGNQIGFYGEYAVMAHTGAGLADTFDYDLVTKDGVKIEVKTKGTTRDDAPELHYMASVATANTKQGCDVYFFARALYTKSKVLLGPVWVMGFMPRDEFYDKAVFYKKNDTDPSNGYRVHQDCWNVPIGELYQWNAESEKEILAIRS